MCAACSEVYRGDAWQLVVSGLRGGKGVPQTVAEHPLVFATFTAPSFGPVHTVREAWRFERGRATTFGRGSGASSASTGSGSNGAAVLKLRPSA